MTASSSPYPLLLLHLLPVLFLSPCYSQQPYINNAQLDCFTTNASSALGYSCNGVTSSCSTYLIYRAKSPYLSATLIGSVLSVDAGSISRLTLPTDVAPLPTDIANFATDDILLTLVPCSCSNGFYQYSTSYTLKTPFETYFTVANDTYEGLSTCQALIDQNSYSSRNVSAGDNLVVPLRCACPTLNQTRAGVKYLLSYLVTWDDDMPTISQSFGADFHSLLSANQLHEKSVIYPFTTLLIPLSTEPTAVPSQASPVPKVSDVPPPPSGGGRSSHTGVFVGIGVAFALVLIVDFTVTLF